MIAERVYDMTPLEDAIITIYNYLFKLKRPLIRLLNNGLDRNRIIEKTKAFPFKLPEELIELYGIYNGTRIPENSVLDDLHFFPGFYFLSIEDAMIHYNVFKSDNRWQQNWFPIFANGGGDFYAVACQNANVEKGQIVGFILGEEKHPVEYSSVTSMMSTIAECFERGVFFQTFEGYLETDDMFQIRIAQKYNPNISIWFE